MKPIRYEMKTVSCKLGLKVKVWIAVLRGLLDKILDKDVSPKLQKHTRSSYQFFKNIYPTAFDTVNHQILLAKLKKYGIDGLEYLWLQSYLENRRQFCRVNGEHALI